ncbi:MAG: prolyl oligopeptidase family serine peptidase [Planctomycetaceae bacterium]|nr:prolyl oligopeptidase family serine peptidase [Planctomycetaceae bacterium]
MRSELKTTMLLIAAVSWLGGCGGSRARMPVAPGEQKGMTMSRKVDVKLNYLLYLPKDYSEKKAWPLMVFLHGAGERGSNLEQLKLHGPPKLIAEGQDFEFIVVSPQCPADKWWVGMDSYIIALVDETMEKYNVDKDRVYLTGLSMGGYGTWNIGANYPERFAALAPICGGSKSLVAAKLKNIPIWAFHGEKDNVVPVSESVQIVDAVNAAGGNAKLTLYPEAGHDSWTQTYANPELYTWLLSHSRSKDE